MFNLDPAFLTTSSSGHLFFSTDTAVTSESENENAPSLNDVSAYVNTKAFRFLFIF